MIGKTLGSYRIVDELGAGGMGVVYVAEHHLLGRKAVVKLLLPEFSGNKDLVERFFNEARAATMIEHPGIVSIFDFGYAEDGSAYIVMELLEGESLSDRIARDGALANEAIARMSRQVGSALARAHEIGIIHRDLKPDNIFIVPDAEAPGGERAKILDFGIAKLTGDMSVGTKTRTGMMMGTPLYMAPEQCRGAGEVDARADIYALGCVMYHMACGVGPFEGGGVGEILVKQISEAPAPPRSHAPQLSPAIEQIILRALEKDPAARQQTMRDLVAEIDAVTGARHSTPICGVPIKTSAQPSRPTEADTTLSSATAEPIVVESRRRGGAPWLGLAAVVVLLAAGGAGLALTRGGAGDPETPREAVAPQTSEDLVEAEPPEQVAAPAPTAAELSHVTLRITTTPGDAEVYRVVDGARLGTTPFEKTLARDDAELVLLVKKHGYESEEIVIPLTEDVTRDLALEPRRRGGATQSRQKSRPARAQTSEPAKMPAPTPKHETARKPESGKNWGETYNPMDE